MKTLSLSNVKGSVLTSIATAAAMFGTTLTNAEEARDVPSVAVHYGDLDHETTEGTNQLYQRIVKAAEKVCTIGATRDLGMIARVHACEADAVSRAVHQVNSPQLAARERHNGHG